MKTISLLLIIPLLLAPTLAMATNSHVESGNTTCDYPDIYGKGPCLPVTHEGRLVGTTGPTECHKETCEAVIGQNQTR
jgi:hypothetical protein